MRMESCIKCSLKQRKQLKWLTIREKINCGIIIKLNVTENWEKYKWPLTGKQINYDVFITRYQITFNTNNKHYTYQHGQIAMLNQEKKKQFMRLSMWYNFYFYVLKQYYILFTDKCIFNKKYKTYIGVVYVPNSDNG